MTLRDFLNAGIVIDGYITVAEYDEKTDKTEYLDIKSDEALDAEIKYMYGHGYGELCIEVSRQL